MKIRIHKWTLLMALLAASAAWSEGFVSTGFSQADFRGELPVDKLARVLGSGAGQLYVSRQDGAVEVMGKDGKSMMVLATKSGGKRLLQQPEAAAVENGIIYVVDSETEQVVMYDALSGKVLGYFGNGAGGELDAGAALDEPHGIAVHEGVVYVADTDNARIQQFGVNGVFMGTLQLALPTGKAEDQNLEIRKPLKVVVDAAGRFYILDGKSERVSVYDAAGKFIRQLAQEKNAVPVALAAGEDGVYVVDRISHMITKYDFNGKVSYLFGSKGEGRGQFLNVSGIAVDQAQQVFVGDAKKAVVDTFVVEPGQMHEPIPRQAGKVSVQWLEDIPLQAGKLASDGQGGIYALSREGQSVVHLRADRTQQEFKLGNVSLSAIAVDKSGAIWVLDKRSKRGMKLSAEGEVVLSFGSAGSGAGQLSDPSAITVPTSGLVFVADRANHNVQVFRQDGVFLNTLNGENAAKIKSPIAMTQDELGNLYILDGARKSVLLYAANGKSGPEIGRSEAGSALARPVAVAVANGEIFILEEDGIKVFTPDRKLLRTLGGRGRAAGALSNPVDLTIGAAGAVWISDNGNKRIQKWATLYKPAAPAKLSAQSKVHGIGLRWEQAGTDFIKQYRIYRSGSEQAGFSLVGTSTTNQYTDTGLEPGGRYFYRVGCETNYGYEGATSAVVSEAASKFVPPVLTEGKAETTPWQARLTWAAAGSEYFTAYRIYEKNAEGLKLLGEAKEPEYVRDKLTPDTAYAFYVTTLSSDGTESEKLEIAATTQVFNRPPLEIEVLQLSDVFANSYKMYEREGLGRIRVSNNTNRSMERLKVTFQLKGFMDFPTELKLDKLLPGQSEELVLKAVFGAAILSLTEDSSVQAMIEASYFENGKRVAYTKNPTVTIYDKHRLTWDERERFAAFITPKDGPVINMVRSVVTQFRETKDEAQLAAALFDSMGAYGMTYIQDPTNPYQVTSAKVNTVDYIQFPRETLERKSGDCDDLVAFYVSALESMGIETRVLEVPGHMFMMFSTGIEADTDGYDMNKMYVLYEGKMWVPVETTLVGGPFVKAWEKGASAYYRWKDKGLTVLDISAAWGKYKPASLPEVEWKAAGVERAAMEKKYPGDHLSVLKISSQTKTRHYLNAIKANPTDADAHLQMGIILAKAGDRGEAMKYFDKVISLNPKHAAAYNNRGNVFMMEDNYKDAQQAYQQAVKLAPQDAYIWLNLARASKAQKNAKAAKAAFQKAVKLKPEIKNEYRALALELLSAM